MQIEKDKVNWYVNPNIYKGSKSRQVLYYVNCASQMVNNASMARTANSIKLIEHWSSLIVFPQLFTGNILVILMNFS